MRIAPLRSALLFVQHSSNLSDANSNHIHKIFLSMTINLYKMRELGFFLILSKSLVWKKILRLKQTFCEFTRKHVRIKVANKKKFIQNVIPNI